MKMKWNLTRRWVLVMLLFAGVVVPSKAETLLHYDFSAGSGDRVTDLSGSGHDGVLVGFDDTSAGAGQFGVSEGWLADGGLSFLDDDIRSFVDTPLELGSMGDPASGTVSHTVEFLASFAESQGWTPAIGSDHGPGFSGDEAFFFGIDSSITQIHVRTPAGGAGNVGPHPWLADAGSMVSETVHHLAYVYDFDSGEVETFVDGESAGVSTPGAALDMTLADGTVFRIGNVGWNGGEQWGGVLQGVAITGDRLDAESFALTNGNQPGTLLHYDFSDGSGDSVTDLSGNGNDGDLIDFQDTSSGAGVFNTSEGWVTGGGLSFLDDGQRSYVDTPLEVNVLEESFTIEFTTNYAAPDGWSPVVGSDVDPFDGNHTVFAGINDDGTQLHFRGPGWAGNIGEQPWLRELQGGDEELHHVAMRYDEETGEVETYVDGELLGTIDLPNSDYNFSTALFRIANVGWAGGEQWAGVIHGVAISDAYLDPEQFVLPKAMAVPGDYNSDGVVDAEDADLHAVARKEPNPDLTVFDENDDGVVSEADLVIWAHDHAATWVGDADLNGEFNSGDLVKVFTDGLYETGRMAGWASGDWDGDMLFDSGDFVTAFSDGGYEQGPRAAAKAVPEPTSFAMLITVLIGIAIRRRCFFA